MSVSAGFVTSRNSLAALLQGTPYAGYSYAYPHKTAYREFRHPEPLSDLWQCEDRSRLFLYVHLPFCEMRCGFCNLFTQAQPASGVVHRYLDAVEREMSQVQRSLHDTQWSRLALGGGTPTFLNVDELHRLLSGLKRLGVRFGAIPFAVETSPATAEAEKLDLLRQWGVTRVSIGIQSFLEAEVAHAGRSQETPVVMQTLERIRDAKIPTRNFDLIYGLPGQTNDTWLHSLKCAVAFEPEELFLYPLYVRPRTGLERNGRTWDDDRLGLYRLGRDFLLAAGYEQVSMRMFRKPGVESDADPGYCCQRDGMVGLGCGARSYTRSVHYSREFAVSASGVQAILRDYLELPAADFANACYGFRLDDEEQRRRYLIQSLLQTAGLDLADYEARFDTAARHDFPELELLEDSGLAIVENGHEKLTEAGLERSDAIGPWLYSPRVRSLMEQFDLR